MTNCRISLSGSWRAAVAALLLLGGVSGCGSSPPTHFYALSTAPPAVAPVSLAPGVVLQVDAVTIPPQLDRLQLVRRSGTNQVDISGLERWAAPLDEQIRRALSDDLADRLAPGEVIGPEAAAPPPDRLHVAVDIDTFTGDLGGAVALRAHWALLQNDQAKYRAVAAINLPGSGTDAGDIAAAMSAALGQLADQIALAAVRVGR